MDRQKTQWGSKLDFIMAAMGMAISTVGSFSEFTDRKKPGKEDG